jgi:RNA methyltransferase, TrmH family
MEIISSTTNNTVKKWAELKIKKYRDTSDYFLVEGDHLVQEADNAGLLVSIMALPDFTSNINVPITYITREVMQKLSSMESISKCLGLVKKFKPLTYGNRILLLDRVQDPGNLGTIIRSACAFNFDTIILGNGCVDLYNEKVIRATEGMMFHVNIMSADLIKIIKELKQNNYQVYGTDVVKGVPLNKVDISDKLAVIMGSEGQGISSEIKKLVTENIYIPLNSTVESLNVAVASSIIMYEMSKIDYE